MSFRNTKKKKKNGCEGEGEKKNQRMENVSGNGRAEIQEGGDKKKKCEESISEGGKEVAKKKSGKSAEGRRESSSRVSVLGSLSPC